MEKQTIVLAGGCFWCTEAVFQMLKGITGITPGYTGGSKPNPTYEEVCAGTTGHAEAIKIEYRTGDISLEDILAVFFATHDPTQLNRQGNDIGTQYRSAIYYATNDQRLTAEKYIASINASHALGKPVVTEIKPLTVFYPAENYHQNYYKNNPAQGYCQVVINPKLKKVQEQFAKLLQAT